MIRKHSVLSGSRKTSVSLEEEFWEALKEIALERSTTISAIISDLDAARQHPNLSSAARSFVLEHYRKRCK